MRWNKPESHFVTQLGLKKRHSLTPAMPLPSWLLSCRLSQQSSRLTDTCLASRAADNSPFMLLLGKHSQPGLLGPTEVREFSVRYSQWATGWERAQRAQCPSSNASTCAASASGLLYRPHAAPALFSQVWSKPTASMQRSQQPSLKERQPSAISTDGACHVSPGAD